MAVTLTELQALVAQGESSSLEFKATTGQRSDGARTLAAMLNGFGGRVLFGVTPGGEVLGQQVADRTLEQLATELQRIEPTVVPEVTTVHVTADLSVIIVRVERGQLRPYEHGGRAYKRVANTTVPMSVHEVDQMLLERMHGTDRWENQPAIGWSVGDLDGDEIGRTVREAVRRGRLVDPATTDPVEILRRLGLLSREGVVLRAAVVLFARSDRLLPEFPQCRLRLARFRGIDRSEFIDGREFHGNAFDLLSRAQKFLLDHLPIAGRVVPGSFERQDEPLLPPEALREALANALCHRDYAIGGGSAAVAVDDDRAGLRQIRDALVELRTFGLVAQEGHGRGSRWFLVPRDGGWFGSD